MALSTKGEYRLPLELDPSLERLPLEELVRLGQRKLFESQVLQRASRSTLYARRWREAGLHLERQTSTAAWASIPYTDGHDWLTAQANGPFTRFFVGQPRLWVSNHSRGRARKWAPYGDQDIILLMSLALRLARVVGLQPDDRILTVVEPSPRVGNPLPYLWAEADGLAGGLRLEFIPGSLAMLAHNNWPSFAWRRNPTVLFSRLDEALTLQQALSQAGPTPCASVAEAFPSFRVGLFFGEPLDPKREEIRRSFGLEAFSVYLLAEFPALAVECPAHNGLHLWLDTCFPEIIAAGLPAWKGKGSAPQPAALPLASAPDNLEGELVLTTFGQALPLVRYRTGDRIRLVSKAPCLCGRTHPRIQILGKLNEQELATTR
ncbi:MAG: hypothetical protein NTV33_11615 [Coprothermobacterota bacterium]|nr:hypothetical protein [Coprothermobacterota bacterium]